MTYLASISDWLKPYGVVAWGVIGIASILFLSLALFLYGFAKERIAIADYTKAKATASGINILAATHQDERINLSSFYHPYFVPTENVRFENCELYGPANIALEGCNFNSGVFHECEIVIVRTDRPVIGALKFKFCTFIRFRIYRATFLMNHETYKNMPQVFRDSVRVISDGRIGDI
ncbi:MAG: hypothetical protein AB1513_05870 [Pseudomonadota bacterium]